MNIQTAFEGGRSECVNQALKRHLGMLIEILDKEAWTISKQMVDDANAFVRLFSSETKLEFHVFEHDSQQCEDCGGTQDHNDLANLNLANVSDQTIDLLYPNEWSESCLSGDEVNQCLMRF